MPLYSIIRLCIERETILIYGGGMNVRDWLNVADHCSGINAVIPKRRLGETSNVGGLIEMNNFLKIFRMNRLFLLKKIVLDIIGDIQ